MKGLQKLWKIPKPISESLWFDSDHLISMAFDISLPCIILLQARFPAYIKTTKCILTTISSDLIDEFYQPLKNTTDISLIEILGVIEKQKEPYVGKKN